jgi:FdhE protein
MTRALTGLTVEAVAEQHPEWREWLALFATARAAVADPAWREAVGSTHPVSRDGDPLIAGATLTIDTRRASRLLDELLGHVGAGRIAPGASVAVLEAAVAEDSERLHVLAAETGADPPRFATIAALAAMPLLQACRAAWQERVPAAWLSAACPICGAWASFAEARGLERRLCLRCGRCGAEWAAEVIRCAFCGAGDHDRLRRLVADEGETRAVETCEDCHAYMKTITTLTACPPADVRLLDLVTVDLDVAALTHGYARPAPTPRATSATLVSQAPRGALSRLARWSR